MKKENQNKKEKVSFYTLGCRLNQAETAIIKRGFEADGYQIVNFNDPADLVVINTCTVTANGDADTRRTVNKVNRINAEAKIALVGCQAQVQREKLLELPGVQWVVGNGVKMQLAKVLAEAGTDTPQVITPTIERKSFTIPIAGIDPGRTRANLKIQDGCDFFCSFCEIPFARGRARSREFDDIQKEAEQLVAAGYKELVLTGINIGTYSYEGESLANVLIGLLRFTNLKRIRISSIEPTTIAEDFIRVINSNKKFCRYLHIPIQSGCDEILQAMKRKYTVSEFVKFLSFANDKIPDVCLGTDVIVGFPGETDVHFDETYQMLLESPFAYFHVFSYSDRDHTRSRKSINKVEKSVIHERSKRLRELSLRKRTSFFDRFIDREMPVLFEQKKNGFWTGLTDNYIRVKTESDINLENEIVQVRLEEIEQQAMIGTIA